MTRYVSSLFLSQNCIFTSFFVFFLLPFLPFLFFVFFGLLSSQNGLSLSFFLLNFFVLFSFSVFSPVFLPLFCFALPVSFLLKMVLFLVFFFVFVHLFFGLFLLSQNCLGLFFLSLFVFFFEFLCLFLSQNHLFCATTEDLALWLQWKYIWARHNFKKIPGPTQFQYFSRARKLIFKIPWLFQDCTNPEQYITIITVAIGQYHTQSRLRCKCTESISQTNKNSKNHIKLICQKSVHFCHVVVK